MKYIASCSFGKDSLATIILAKLHNEPLDEIIFAEVMYSHERNISGENPIHIDWIYNVAIHKLEEWGYKVTIVKSKHDYLSLFHHIRTKGNYKGLKNGFPIGGRCILNDRCKVKPIRAYYKSIKAEYIQYIGIAIDEPKRLKTMKKDSSKVSLLEKYGYTEAMSYKLCKEYGLLSPIYEIEYNGRIAFSRGGCWFCPNSGVREFSYLKKHNNDKYTELLELSKTECMASNGFKYGVTFGDLDKSILKYDKKIAFNKRQLSFF